ncbi:DUF6886 family protein [Krasilnikovia sp. M28-CT-15]|uniref:DUF6886 family protein n=1 Tax=Krasilnikovia sp. M28-CT-15 TaxID=3373540 RepID=UPI0038762851
MRPAPGEVLHFSEHPSITSFVPHVAATAQQPDPYVWAVDAEQAPSYWFPRDCPRVLAWPHPGSTAADRERILGPGGGDRVHAIEYGWLARLQQIRLYAYRLPAAPFRPIGQPRPHAMVAQEPVVPLGPAEPVDDLVALHAGAGIQLRLLPNLWGFMDAVAASTLDFSGIRLRNATPRPGTGRTGCAPMQS